MGSPLTLQRLLPLRIAEANVTIIGAGREMTPAWIASSWVTSSLLQFNVSTILAAHALAGKLAPSAFGGAGFTNFAGSTGILEDSQRSPRKSRP